jgi:hypothetical protein
MREPVARPARPGPRSTAIKNAVEKRVALPRVGASDPAVKEAIAGAVRMLAAEVRAGFFKQPLHCDPLQMAQRNNARLYVKHDPVMPPEIRSTILRDLRPPPPTPRTRGRHAPDGYKIRNTIIVSTIEIITKKRGFKPTRNDASRDKGASVSACSIVHVALKRLGVNLAETTIEDIWNHRAVRAYSPK